MITLIDDRYVKVWFNLYHITPKGLMQLPTRYPLEYTDSRFHRALERLRTGCYRGYPVGKTPTTSKPIEINYAEAEKLYDSGIVLEPPKFKVDWSSILNKKEKIELELKQEVTDFSNYMALPTTKNKVLLANVQRYKEGKTIPAHLVREVQIYLAEEYRKLRKSQNE